MSQTRKRLPSAFSSLSYGDFRRFAAAMLFTSLGTQLVQTAIFWQVYELTGDALLLGLSGLARAAPHVALSLVGGVMADRLDRVRLIQAGQVLNAIVVLALASLTLAGMVDLWHLYAITALNGAFTAATQPARTALLPSLVPRGNLVNAVALHSTIFQTSQVTGPALAGAAIATVGLGPAYLLNGVLFLAAMAAIIAVRVPMPSRETYEDPWRSFTHGMAFVRSRPVIISLLVLDLGQTILGSYRALLPIFAEMLGAGPAGYGVLSAAPGVGSVVGAVVILALGDMKYKGLYTVFAILGYCVALVVLAQAPWFLLAVVAAGLLGTANSVQVIPRNSVILALSPAGLRGRVEAFRTMLSGGGPPIGYAFSGAMAAMMGAPLALVVGGIACAVLVAGLGIVHRELRDPDLGATTRVPT